MTRARRGRVALVALASIAAGLLVACGVPPGGADITISGAVTADDPEGAVICKQPGEDGETTIPTWQWTGTIHGEPAQLLFSSQVSSVPEEGGLQIGPRSWIRFVAFDNGSTVTPRPVGDDGTLRLTAHIEPTPGQTGAAIDVVATLRCPGWGDVGLRGDVRGELDGVSRCPAPGEGGSDAYVTYEVRSAQLAGQPTGTIAFAGLNGPAVDTALLQSGGVVWGATNAAGEPPQVAASVDDDGVLTATATFRRLDGQPGSITADATIRCP